MNLDEIVRQLEILRAWFEDCLVTWRCLKTDREFVFGVAHDSYVRKLYVEGISCASYLVSALNTRHLERSQLLSDYVQEVRKVLALTDSYQALGRMARDELQACYRNNATAFAMVRLYDEQWPRIRQVGVLIDQLAVAPQCRLLDEAHTHVAALAVIRDWVSRWESDAQLHGRAGEVQLRAQLVATLRRESFPAVSELHNYQGHCDFAIPRLVHDRPVLGNILVAECKIWDGAAAFTDAVSQLCGYLTAHDDQGLLLVFVKDGHFADILEKGRRELEKHEAFAGWLPNSQHDFELIPAQDSRLSIPTTLMFCNLTTPKYPKSR